MVIDRIEGEVAIIEHAGNTFEVPLDLLPEGAQEGSRLSFTLLPPGSQRANAEARLARLRAQDTAPDHLDL